MKQKKWVFGGLVVLGIILAIVAFQLPPNWFTPDFLVNLSSVLTLISFTVRGILELRLLAIGAQLTFIPYCLMQSPPLWTPATWNLLFLGVNLVNVIFLLLERRPVKFSDEEQALYNLVFKTMSPREFLRVLAVGEWRDGAVGEILTVAGQPTKEVKILCRGEAVACFAGKDMAKVPAGKLLGIPTALVGDPAPVEIKLSQPSRYVVWPLDQLRRFTDKQPEIRNKLRSIASRDLVNTVRRLIDLEEKQLESSQETKSVREIVQDASQRSGLSDDSR